MVVVVSTAAQIAGPALIAYGIDTGLPELVKHQNWLPLTSTVVAYLVAAIVGAWLISSYTVQSARISQASSSTCASGCSATPSC